MKNLLVLRGRFYPLVMVLVASCFNPDSYKNPEPDKTIVLANENTEEIKADGASFAEVRATVSSEAAPNRRNVVFKTDLGSFIDGKGDSIVVFAEDFTARAKLISLRPGVATVTAKILGVTASNRPKVTYVKAYPNNINVSVDSFAVAGDYKGEITLTAALSAEGGGKPSIGHEVVFSVVKPGIGDVGDFLNNKAVGVTDADGKARVRYSPGVTIHRGYVTVTAITQKETPNGPISANTRFYIKN